MYGGGALGRPAQDDDVFLIYGAPNGFAPLLAQRWHEMGLRVVLVLPRAPGPKEPLWPGLRWTVLPRLRLPEALAEPGRLLQRVEPARAHRGAHLASGTAVHLVDLRVEAAADVLGALGALGPRAGRVLFASQARVLGRPPGAGAAPLGEDAPGRDESPLGLGLLDAETVAAQARRGGRVAVALRAAPYVYGPGLQPETPLGPDPLLFERFLHRYPVLWSYEPPPLQPLHWLDLAEGLEWLLGAPDPAPLVHLAGPEVLGWDELLRQLHAATRSPEDVVLELVGGTELSLRRPEALRPFLEWAAQPLLDDSALRRAGFAAERRVAQHAPAWADWSLQQLAVEAEDAEDDGPAKAE